MLDVLRCRADPKGLALSAHVDPALARGRVRPVDRVRQWSVNLPGSAVEFTDAGSVTLTVTPEPAAGDEADRVRFAVTDAAVGIPPDPALAGVTARRSTCGR